MDDANLTEPASLQNFSRLQFIGPKLLPTCLLGEKKE